MASAKGDGKGGGGMIGLIIVTMLAIGCGAGFGFFLDGELKAQTDAAKAKPNDKAAAQKAEVQPNVPPTAKLVALIPIVANLAEPKDAWIRIEASILVDNELQGADAVAAQLAEDIVAYLRTTTLAQFEGASGFQNLREDLMDRAMIRDREHIKDVVIHGVVVE
jgi:flagellar FliL protein